MMRTYWYVIALLSLIFEKYTEVGSVEINMQLFGRGGEITSPNYPNSYPLNLTCIWTLNAEKNERIFMKFLDFQLEQVKRCIYDSVQMREDVSKPWSFYPRYCGRDYPKEVLTRGSKLQLKFSSDSYNIVDKGFKLQWKVREVQPSSSIVTPCPTKSTATVRICPTVSVKNCDCKHTITATNSVTTKKCDNTGSTKCETHILKGSERKADTVVVAAFSTLLVLFIIVSGVLVFMLWRRTRELEYLRTPPKSPDFKWIPGDRFPAQNFEHQNEAQDGSLIRQITNASKQCDNQDCTLCSLNRHLNRYAGTNKFDTNAKSTLPSDMEQYNKEIPRLLSVSERHQGAESDGNSIAESETSDVYVSSCLHSPADTYEREPRTGIYPAKCPV